MHKSCAVYVSVYTCMYLVIYACLLTLSGKTTVTHSDGD